METTIKPITTIEAAAKALSLKIEEAKAKLARVTAEVGDVTKTEEREAEERVDDIIDAPTPESIAAATPRDWAIVGVRRDKQDLANLIETTKLELITPHGNYVLLPKNERLISPAGFHPDERVFIKPSTGATVSVLPKSSNLSYYNFASK